MEKYKYTLCYLGTVPHFSRDELLQICHDIVDELELAPIGERIFEAHDFDDFVHNLRGREVAIVPLLAGLAFKKGTGVTVQFFLNERIVSDKSALFYSLDTTKRNAVAKTIVATPGDGVSWYRLLGATGNKIARGRVLKSTKAKTMKKKQNAKHGLVDVWNLKRGTVEYLNHASIWGNLSITPEANAQKMFPDESLRNAAPNTIRAIFGGRNECALWLKQLGNAKEVLKQ